jgi:hypothetical protein
MLSPDPPGKEGERGTGSFWETAGGGRRGRYSAIKDMPSVSPCGRRGEGGQEVEPRGENVVRKTIHVDDGRRDSPSPAVSREVWAGIPKYFMALMGEEGCSRSK